MEEFDRYKKEEIEVHKKKDTLIKDLNEKY